MSVVLLSLPPYFSLTQVPTFGPRPNTEFIKSLGSNVLTDAGFVKVKPTLELAGHSRIFAMGDIIDWKEEKQAMKAMGHKSIVANNVLSVLGQNLALKNYEGSREIILLSNGRVSPPLCIWRRSSIFFVRMGVHRISVCCGALSLAILLQS